MRILRFLVVLACGMFFAVSQAYAVDINREYHETFDTEPGMRLHLENGDGDVSITPWAKDQVEIHVRYVGEITKIGIGKVDTDFRVDFDVDGKTIYAKGREPGSGIVFGFLSQHDVKYRWTINAPSYLMLEIKGDDGDIVISDWEADIRTYLDDGDFILDGSSGRLKLHSEDGDIVLRNCSTEDARIFTDDGEILIDGAYGSFEIESEDGDIELDQIEVTMLSVQTDDGRVRISKISGFAPEIDVHTDDGDVRLSFVAGTSYSFIVHHDDGPVRIDVGKVLDLKQEEGRVQGTVGAGKGHVRVRTDDGRVTLTGDKSKAQ